MVNTLYEHICDQCGKVHVEKREGSWIQGWYSVRTSNSMCYSTNIPSKNFCSAACLTSWSIREQMSLDIEKQLKSPEKI